MCKGCNYKTKEGKYVINDYLNFLDGLKSLTAQLNIYQKSVIPFEVSLCIEDRKKVRKARNVMKSVVKQLGEIENIL